MRHDNAATVQSSICHTHNVQYVEKLAFHITLTWGLLKNLKHDWSFIYNTTLSWLLFRVVSKFQLYVLSFLHEARVWRTDGQNYDPQDCASIAASRGKKWPNREILPSWIAAFWHASVRSQLKIWINTKRNNVWCKIDSYVNKTFSPRPRPKPRLWFLSFLETKTLSSRTTSLKIEL